MSLRVEVLRWANLVIARKGAAPHELLDCGLDSDMTAVQEAFHKIARMAHPDLHRNTLSADDLEIVTTAYSRIAGAYAELRTQRMKTTRMRPIKEDPIETATTVPIPTVGGAPTPEPAVPQIGAAGSMSSKALVYFRKAEMALRRGDLRGAVLQLKMAIASDPQSTFLRSALGEVEAELRK